MSKVAPTQLIDELHKFIQEGVEVAIAEQDRYSYQCPVCGAENDDYGPGCGCYEDIHYGKD